jgi:hypothetical protein
MVTCTTTLTFLHASHTTNIALLSGVRSVSPWISILKRFFLARSLSSILVDGRRLGLRIGNNDVLSNAISMPFDYALAFMHVIKDLDS